MALSVKIPTVIYDKVKTTVGKDTDSYLVVKCKSHYISIVAVSIYLFSFIIFACRFNQLSFTFLLIVIKQVQSYEISDVLPRFCLFLTTTLNDKKSGASRLKRVQSGGSRSRVIQMTDLNLDNTILF